MKKEIGKLIELLNEYEGQDTWSYDEEMGMPYYGWGDDCDYEAYLISKKYGFIKWLVENEKVDLEKAKTLKSGHNAELFDFIEWFDGTMEVINYHYFEDYEQLLMLLSISDTPIEDLISYLK